ncbi:MAG: hypothetical protein OQK46_02610, partial [Gammaproteobacteria bacterium]|nr:hypothetical protein [Gammaproteobacteria bacterium]
MEYTQEWTQTPYPLAEGLRVSYPEFEQTAVIREVWGEYLAAGNDIVFYAKEGFYALPEEDLKELPDDMDFSNDPYREMLKGFFGIHQNAGNRSFDFFYQAQVLWDE